MYMILSYTEICFVWCIEENKSNDIVCCESNIQCRYFYGIIRIWITTKRMAKAVLFSVYLMNTKMEHFEEKLFYRMPFLI